MGPFYTQKLLRKPLDTQNTSSQNNFAQRTFYTEKLLHANAFIHRYKKNHCTEQFPHAETVTQRNHCTEQLSHTDFFTQRNLYTEQFLHTDDFTQSGFYTRRFNTQKTLTPLRTKSLI